jgi:hypothetical protein
MSDFPVRKSTVFLTRFSPTGVPWTEALTKMPTAAVVAGYVARTGMNTNEHACLFPKYLELMERLGIPGRKRGTDAGLPL